MPHRDQQRIEFTPRSIARRSLLAVTFSGVVTLTACGTQPAEDATATSAPPSPAATESAPLTPVAQGGVAEMQEALPSSTAQDWVTYADHVVTVTATSAHRGDPDAGVDESGEGIVPRFVTLRVDESLWSREGAPEPPPSELEIIWGGWSVSEGEDEQPFITADTVEISVGSSYVLPVVYLALFDESPSWTPLSVAAVLPVADGTIGRGSRWNTFAGPQESYQPPADDPNVELRREVWGRPVSYLTSVLTATPADPAAEPFMDAEPADRYQSVLAGEWVDVDGDDV